MAKRSNGKNIILTNLPAAVALILMAAALKLTLKFSFFISLLVLIVVYFILGVLIELIIDKLQTRRKKEDLFQSYAEGRKAKLPGFEKEIEDGELFKRRTHFTSGRKEASQGLHTVLEEKSHEKDVQEAASDVFGKENGTVPVELPDEAEETESPAFTRGQEAPSEEASEPAERENMQESPETDSDEEPETDSFLNIKLNDLKEETAGRKDAEDLFENLFSKKLGEIELAEAEGRQKPEDAAEEKLEAQEAVVAMTSEIVQVQEAAEEDALEETAPAAVPEDIAEASEQEEETVQVEAVSEEEDPSREPDETEASVSEGHERGSSLETAGEDDEELAAVLQEVGAVSQEPEKESIPPEEAEARRSLFDDEDAFDADFGTRGRRNTSVVFESVPDTEDDFDYIPDSDLMETPVAIQKGKVKVDSKKIDDLYAFKKEKAGENFFGRKKR